MDVHLQLEICPPHDPGVTSPGPSSLVSSGERAPPHGQASSSGAGAAAAELGDPGPPPGGSPTCCGGGCLRARVHRSPAAALCGQMWKPSRCAKAGHAFPIELSASCSLQALKTLRKTPSERGGEEGEAWIFHHHTPCSVRCCGACVL